MAKILVCADGFFRAFSPLGLEPYIEGFINTLVRNGNDVLPYIACDFTIRKKLSRKVQRFQMRHEILTFNPDLIITFNNALDPYFAKKTDCPILVVASDSPLYWNHKDFIKKNVGRYSVAFFNNDMSEVLYSEYKIPRSRQITIPYSTDMHADRRVHQKYDISFIGNFYNANTFLSDIFLPLLKRNSLSVQKKLKGFIFSIIDELDEAHKKTPQALKIYRKFVAMTGIKIDFDRFVSECFLMLTHQKRQALLTEIKDMDLHIWTFNQNFKILCNNYQLFKKCHLEPCYSQAQNEAVYNASKISLNMPHAQVNTGFSWRVCDILASNALLLSNPTDDLTRLFDGVIPTYTSPEDLKKKAIYYLKQDKERQEIVKICHDFIDKNHRYENVFQKIGDYYNIPLINQKEGLLHQLTRTIRKQKKYLRKHPNG